MSTPAIVEKLPPQNSNGTALVAPTPMHLIEIAVSQGADVDKLEKLLQLQLQWEKNEARKAFVEAMAAFKIEPPEINKNKHVTYNQVDYWHATLDHVVETIAAGLSKHGLAHRWKTEQSGGQISVTCILTHKMGHSEETTLSAAADMSGSKNAIQAVGSTVTYLQRYTLLAATGLAAKGQDDDGRTEGMEGQAIEDYLTTIRDSSTNAELDAKFKAAYQAAVAAGDQKLQLRFIAAKDARRKEIR